MYRSAGVKTDGTMFVMLGLEEENIRRLHEEDKPIKVNLRHLDPDGPPVIQLPELELVIYFANPKNIGLAEDMVRGSAPHTVLGGIMRRQKGK